MNAQEDVAHAIYDMIWDLLRPLQEDRKIAVNEFEGTFEIFGFSRFNVMEHYEIFKVLRDSGYIDIEVPESAAPFVIININHLSC